MTNMNNDTIQGDNNTRTQAQDPQRTAAWLSELARSSVFPTRCDTVPKLPQRMEGMKKEDIEAALLRLYQEAVERRGHAFIGIAGTEVEDKLRKAAEWMVNASGRCGLLLQGSVGSGKTSVLYAIYALYKAAGASLSYCTAPRLYDHARLHLNNEASLYDDYRQAKYLFMDDLGTEPERCLIYGTEYTPIQDILSYRYDRCLPTIITTNLTDTQIRERYGERCADRINEMFTILRLKGPSYRK